MVRAMHLNKLSTAALMRLTILAALNLFMGRLLDGWLVMLHPLFFLSVLTLDLGLYAVMVYSGTLNRTPIAMMLTGLVGVLTILAWGGGLGASLFMNGGPFRDLALLVEEDVNRLVTWWTRVSKGRLVNLRGDSLLLLAYVPVDLAGVATIVAVGWLARALQERARRREHPAPPPPLDAGAASPL
jgi:hypothetical protein